MGGSILAALVAVAMIVIALFGIYRKANRLGLWARIAIAVLAGAIAGASWALISRREHDLPWATMYGESTLVLSMIQEIFLSRR